jgi:hypothetical protein
LRIRAQFKERRFPPFPKKQQIFSAAVAATFNHSNCDLKLSDKTKLVDQAHERKGLFVPFLKMKKLWWNFEAIRIP